MVTKKEVEQLKKEYFQKVDELITIFLNPILKRLINLFKQGSQSASSSLERNVKPVEPSQQEVNIFQDLIYDNIKGVSEEFRRQISNELNFGLSQSETKKQLITRLDNLFQGDNPTRLKYENRLKLILNTESARIFNSGSFKTAKRLKAKYKYLIGVGDSREAQDSKIALAKYGSPEKAIPIDEPFEYTYRGQKRVFMFPPDRPRDRSTCLFLYEKPE